MWKLSCVGVACLASVSLAFTSSAQTYPDKPVRVIVPAPPGGALDIIARYVTQKLSEPFGAQFIVDNRGGAGGGIGADAAARAAPDGYTLLLSSSSAVSVNPHFVPRAADPLQVFTPIVLVGWSPNVLVIHPSVPAKSVKELIAVAKARPDALAFGSNGAGSLSHLTGALFMQRAGIRMLHVPYKGAAPAVIDTMAGNVSVLFAAYASASTQARSAKLRALAVTSAKRVEIAPDLPTIAESALPGFESTQWWGVYGPAGLQGNVVTRLNAELNRILHATETRKRFAIEGAEPAGGTPAELAAYHKADYEKWGKVIRSAGIKGE
ncbi:MAG: tripartite tricarboxylate transporter substrate binding protein [Betaproteobacteria bacterium]|jgi:tripartite-type tricarboxylate transporter receptor subunit TctC|nr:tripartite tricarboxylate transporter substrate binding protein [Betaproteobacteria bacterium]